MLHRSKVSDHWALCEGNSDYSTTTRLAMRWRSTQYSTLELYCYDFTSRFCCGRGVWPQVLCFLRMGTCRCVSFLEAQLVPYHWMQGSRSSFVVQVKFGYWSLPGLRSSCCRGLGPRSDCCAWSFSGSRPGSRLARGAMHQLVPHAQLFTTSSWLTSQITRLHAKLSGSSERASPFL